MTQQAPGKTARKPEISALTAVRWFAAVWVVCLHYAPVSSSAPLWLRSFTSYGYLAVDFFFLLSGFILAYNYDDLGPDGRGKFWMSRFARIYPDYLFALLLAAPFAFQPTARAFVKGVVVASLLQSWLPQTAFAWNSPAWSVSNEAFFYATFPFALAAIRAKSRNSLWVIALVCLAISAATRFLGNSLAPAGLTNVSIFFTAFPLVRWPQFLIGVASGVLFLRGIRIPVWLGFAVLVSLFAAAPMLTTATVGSVAIAGFALLVHGLAGASGWASVAFAPIVRPLGQASYAMYLLQEPIARYLGYGSWPRFAAYFATLTVASVVVFRLIEEPSRELLRRNSSWLVNRGLSGNRSLTY
jgi:peptidoglycan/LPS O-acetylase OafA/YrhL